MQWYANAFVKAFGALTDISNGVVATLHTSSYAVNRFTDSTVSNLTNELAASGGYSTGGASVGALTATVTVANSWGVSRAASTAYALGDVVRPASGNGFLYRATSAGTTGASLPTYPTILGQTVVDGGVTWECYGSGIIVVTSASPPSWATATFTGVRYLVLSDRTTGVAGTSPLLAFIDFVTDQSGGGGTFQVNPHAALGVAHIAIP